LALYQAIDIETLADEVMGGLVMVADDEPIRTGACYGRRPNGEAMAWWPRSAASTM
jgi:hypothetical protein